MDAMLKKIINSRSCKYITCEECPLVGINGIHELCVFDDNPIDPFSQIPNCYNITDDQLRAITEYILEKRLATKEELFLELL